jgi:hypothetical protein
LLQLKGLTKNQKDGNLLTKKSKALLATHQKIKRGSTHTPINQVRFPARTNKSNTFGLFEDLCGL